MKLKRRDFITNSLALTGAVGLSRHPSNLITYHKNIDGNRLVLLGTQGGPFIRSYVQTPSSNLIAFENKNFVIDAGYGVTFKLKDAGINLSKINYIFITHHHSDHNLELGPLLYNCWIAGLSEQIHVYAPIGLKDMLFHYWESNRIDIDMRISNEGRPDIRKLVIAHEISEGIIMSNEVGDVSALKNIHPPFVESFAYKFKLNNKIIVFSGDTAYCQPLISFAKDADYLVHEVMDGDAVSEMVKSRPNATKLKESILSHHTLAVDVGKIATEAGVKNLILNHFVPPDNKNLTDEIWLNAVRKTYSGNVFVGKDLAQFPL